MAALSEQIQGPDLCAVDDLARAHRKIEAIKRHRELTGRGLAGAKAYVDRIG